MCEQLIDIKTAETIIGAALAANKQTWDGLLVLLPILSAFFSPLIVLWFTLARDKKRQKADHEHQMQLAILGDKNKKRHSEYEIKKDAYARFLAVYLEEAGVPSSLESLRKVSVAIAQVQIVASPQVREAIVEFQKIYMPFFEKLKKLFERGFNSEKTSDIKVEILQSLFNNEDAERYVNIGKTVVNVAEAMITDMDSLR